jgi:hypothetical protein
MVCFITIISLTRQGWAWPHEMTRTFIIAIAAVLYVLAAKHAHQSMTQRPRSKARSDRKQCFARSRPTERDAGVGDARRLGLSALRIAGPLCACERLEFLWLPPAPCTPSSRAGGKHDCARCPEGRSAPIIRAQSAERQSAFESCLLVENVAALVAQEEAKR